MTTTRTLYPAGRRRLGLALGAIAVVALVATGCAAGPGLPQAGDGTQVAGFWLGLWHGLILPITFVISLFTDSVSVYEIHNNGNWYDFGFVLGIAVSFGGSHAGSAAGRRSGRG